MSVLEKAKLLRSKKENKIEKIKASQNPMDVYARLETIATGGYENLDKDESAYFLKCFGLFDKGEDFMLRVRVPVGQLSYQEALAIAHVAKTYGKDTIDISTRMQIVLRYIQIENIAIVLKILRDAGLSTFQTGVDNLRNIVADPLDGLAYDTIIETKPLVDEIQRLTIDNPEWVSVLPRKFNAGILGSLSNSCNIYGHDCCFILANNNGLFGFNVYLGAKVGIQASDLDIFLSQEEVVPFFIGLLELFKRYGYRDNRNKNRLYFLLKDVGIEAFRLALEDELGYTLLHSGQTMVQSQNIALGANKVLQRNGHYAYKIIVPAGIFTGTKLQALAQEAKEFASGDLRLTYDQNIYVVNLKKENIPNFESSTVVDEQASFDNIYFNDMIACAGTRTCSFAVIPCKEDAIDMATFLKSEINIKDGVVRINWSACPKGCGVHGIGDIGFEGCKAKDSEGNRVDGVHIFIAGKMTHQAKEAKLLHKAIPLFEARYHVKYLVKLYNDFKLKGETFETFEERYLSANYSYQALSFYTKINYILNEVLDLNIYFSLEQKPKTYKKENFEIFDFGIKLFHLLTQEKRYEAIDEDFEIILSHPKKITRDEVSTHNNQVPKKLSEVIYMMTDNDKKTRAAVFSELLVALKEL